MHFSPNSAPNMHHNAVFQIPVDISTPASIKSAQTQNQSSSPRTKTGGRMRRFVLLAALLCLTGSVAFAQDPVKVDPKHYKVEFENAQVRILRIHYGPHEKSVMP